MTRRRRRELSRWRVAVNPALEARVAFCCSFAVLLLYFSFFCLAISGRGIFPAKISADFLPAKFDGFD
jgi:hypothetical protein